MTPERALAADPVMARVIARVGPCGLFDRLERDRFRALARSIIYQQLAGAAARTIWGRLVERTGDPPRPAALLRMSDRAFSAAGVSPQKRGYLRDLAARTRSGDLPVSRLARMRDDEVVEVVTRVKGIGRWTAEMFLMFSLGRPDVFSTGDLGLQKAMRRLYRVRTPDGMLRVAERWRPHRTAACWYLWRSLE